MAERKRSKDGSRDTEKLMAEEGEPAIAGRAGGDLAERIGAQDEEKRVYERPAGVTRVGKSEEQSGGEKDDGQ